MAHSDARRLDRQRDGDQQRSGRIGPPPREPRVHEQRGQRDGRQRGGSRGEQTVAAQRVTGEARGDAKLEQPEPGRGPSTIDATTAAMPIPPFQAIVKYESRSATRTSAARSVLAEGWGSGCGTEGGGVSTASASSGRSRAGRPRPRPSRPRRSRRRPRCRSRGSRRSSRRRSRAVSAAAGWR